MAKKIAAGVALLLGVAALMFALRSCSGEETPSGDPAANPSASPSATPSLAPVKMATTRISSAIKTRLDEVSGRPTRVECPKRVAQKIGTAFDCDVFFEDEAESSAPVALAEVEIDGPDGHFSWKSTPVGQD